MNLWRINWPVNDVTVEKKKRQRQRRNGKVLLRVKLMKKKKTIPYDRPNISYYARWMWNYAWFRLIKFFNRVVKLKEKEMDESWFWSWGFEKFVWKLLRMSDWSAKGRLKMYRGAIMSIFIIICTIFSPFTIFNWQTWKIIILFSSLMCRFIVETKSDVVRDFEWHSVL